MIVGLGLDHSAELARIEQAAQARLCELHAGQRSARARFIKRDVRALADHDFIARARVHEQRDLIAHGARGHEQRALLAEHGGGAPLELDHCRVFTVHVVAHDGVRHRLAHGAGRPSHGVRAEIENGFGAHARGVPGGYSGSSVGGSVTGWPARVRSANASTNSS